MSAEEYIEHQLARAPPFDEGSDLFSRHHSPDLHTNLAYMARTHGFYLPYFEYIKDLQGLLRYLQEKIYVGNVALATGKRFHSTEAVQAHMRAKGACRISLEGSEDELGPFYDMEAIAAGSPLWEVDDEAEYDTEEDETDDDADADVAMPSAEVAVMEFDELCDRAVSVGVLTDGQVDQLTDALAGGEATEAELIHRYEQLVLRAEAVASGGAPNAESLEAVQCDDDAMSVSSSVAAARVRYKIMPSSHDGVSMQLPKKEVGHREFRRYYKQHFRPSAGTVYSSSPELDALMLQYAKAGVLSTHMQKRFVAPGTKRIKSASQQASSTKVSKYEV